MLRLSHKPIGMIIVSLVLLLILTLAFFGAQLFAANQALAKAPDLITNQQIAAITGGEQLLLGSTITAVYLPMVYK